MHLLFDLDGTLTDSQSGIIRSIRHALAENGLPAPAAEHAPLGASARRSSRPSQNWWERIPPPCSIPSSPATASATVASGCLKTRSIRTSKPLWQNSPTTDTSCTSPPPKRTIYAARIIEHFELAEYFDTVDGSELDGTRADKTSLIAHILEREGIAPADAIMIGDREHDMIGTTANGVPGIGVLWGYGSEEELTSAGAFACIRSPRDLAETIRLHIRS